MHNESISKQSYSEEPVANRIHIIILLPLFVWLPETECIDILAYEN